MHSRAIVPKVVGEAYGIPSFTNLGTTAEFLEHRSSGLSQFLLALKLSSQPAGPGNGGGGSSPALRLFSAGLPADGSEFALEAGRGIKGHCTAGMFNTGST